MLALKTKTTTSSRKNNRDGDLHHHDSQQNKENMGSPADVVKRRKTDDGSQLEVKKR
jgi:hypothetical protein